MLVFDLDDTLYKEADYVASGKSQVNLYLRSLNPRFSDEQLDAVIWDEEVRRIYREHVPSISLSDDARNALSALKLAGIPMAIITDGRAVQQRNKFHALELSDYIPEDRLMISEEIGCDKTKPTAFLKLMSSFSAEEQWIYVGDNPEKDFIQPNLLNWQTVMLLDPANINIHPQLPLSSCPLPHRPKHLINSLTELIDLFVNQKV